MSEKNKYSRPGNTCWTSDKKCPECGGVIVSNGKMFDCTDCEWWNPIDKEK